MQIENRIVIIGLGQRKAGGTAGAGAWPGCPRCGAENPVKLDKSDSKSNDVFRCRSCGHVFSPKE